jgi:putative aldouronate transport system substrate-binding protein
MRRKLNMNKQMKWLIVLTLIFTMVLAGCSNTNESNSTTNSGNNKTTASGDDSTGETSEISFPLDESITLEIFAQKRAEAGEYEEMSVLQAIQEKSNVNVEWTTITSSGGLNEKKNLLFASNDLPDAFYGRALTDDEIIKYGTQGMLIPLEDLIEEHAPNLQKIFKDYPNLKKDLTAKDGHIYSLPMMLDNGFTDAVQTLFINKKWLDQLSLEVPETTEEFVTVLKAFRDNDMNGNGKDDEIPLSFVYGNHTQGENGLNGSFGIVASTVSDYIFVDDGTAKYVPAQPEYKEFLTYIHSLYSQKLIDPEAFTHKPEVYQSKIKSEEKILGVFVGWSNALYFGEADSDYIAIPPMEGPNGDRLWYRAAPQIFKNGFSITSENEHPEITLKWIDLSYDENTSLELAYGGPFGVNLEESADGTITLTAPPEGMNGNEFKHSNAPGAFGAYAVTRELFNKINGTKNEREKREYIKMYEPYLPEVIFPALYFSAEDLGMLEQLKTDITEGYMKVTVPNFMINGVTDAKWDEYTSQLNKMGLEDMVAIYQRNYDEYISME